MRRFMTFVSATLFISSLALPALAGNFSAPQKTEIEELVHAYLLEHPEILQDMANKLDAKQKEAEASARMTSLKGHAPELFHNAADAVIGNPKGDVTMVEFMDYNCSWCKKSVKEVQALVDKDKNVRVVMKEFPIFGAGSEYAAKAALAAVRQGKYWQLHQALFASESKVTAEVVDKIAAEQGLDVAKMKADMQDPVIAANIRSTQILAQTLLFTGTPAFVVDDKVSPGYVAIDVLQAMLTTVRANGGCKIC
jgi:protein-disulfide isomerase